MIGRVTAILIASTVAASAAVQCPVGPPPPTDKASCFWDEADHTRWCLPQSFFDLSPREQAARDRQNHQYQDALANCHGNAQCVRNIAQYGQGPRRYNARGCRVDTAQGTQVRTCLLDAAPIQARGPAWRAALIPIPSDFTPTRKDVRGFKPGMIVADVLPKLSDLCDDVVTGRPNDVRGLAVACRLKDKSGALSFLFATFTKELVQVTFQFTSGGSLHELAKQVSDGYKASGAIVPGYAQGYAEWIVDKDLVLRLQTGVGAVGQPVAGTYALSLSSQKVCLTDAQAEQEAAHRINPKPKF